ARSQDFTLSLHDALPICSLLGTDSIVFGRDVDDSLVDLHSVTISTGLDSSGLAFASRTVKITGNLQFTNGAGNNHTLDLNNLSRSEEHTSELQSLRHLVC